MVNHSIYLLKEITHHEPTSPRFPLKPQTNSQLSLTKISQTQLPSKSILSTIQIQNSIQQTPTNQWLRLLQIACLRNIGKTKWSTSQGKKTIPEFLYVLREISRGAISLSLSHSDQNQNPQHHPPLPNREEKTKKLIINDNTIVIEASVGSQFEDKKG